MKRKKFTEEFSLKMMKMSEEVMKNQIEPVTRISTSLSRNFGYKFSDKKAKSNLLKGAARESFEIIERQLGSILNFSAGSFLECVIPMVLKWRSGNKVLENEDLVLKIEGVLPSYDKNGKHMETLITFTVDGHKIVVCCYYTTQRVKVEGVGYSRFDLKYLKPLFCDIIKQIGPNKIDDTTKV